MPNEKIPEIDIQFTSVPINVQPRKLSTKWKVKWYGDNVVLIISRYPWVFWFYNIWYKMFPPKLKSTTGVSKEELTLCLEETIKKEL